METVTVKIENEYSDGHRSESTVEVFAPGVGTVLDEWFNDAVFPHTGDGHGVAADLGSCYTATVMHAPALLSSLVGKNYEWVD